MATPTCETVVVAGGLGTQADKSDTNGGGATKAAWDAGSPSDFIGTNGGPIDTCSAGAITDNGSGKVRITSAGNFTNVIVGTLVYCNFSATYTDGVYEITAVDGSGNHIDIDLVWSTNTPTVDCNAGGALAGLDSALANDVNNAASYDRYVLYNAAEVITSGIDIDTYGGSASTRLHIHGYNATLSAKALVTITTESDIEYVLKITTVDYLDVQYLDLDGGGKDASRASYALYAAGTADGAGSLLYHCKFRRAESHGAICRASIYFVRCEFTLNGNNGFNSLSSGGTYFYRCSFHDNDSDGIDWRPTPGIMIDCFVYDNGKDGAGDGMCCDLGVASVLTLVVGTLFYGNHDNGLDFPSTVGLPLLYDNAAIGNGGYGYDFNGAAAGRFVFFGNNLGGANTGSGERTHCSECDDADFTDYIHGDNVGSAQTADQLLETITDGSEDFTPETASDLIGAGLDAGVNGDVS